MKGGSGRLTTKSRMHVYVAGACLANIPLWLFTLTFSYDESAALRTLLPSIVYVAMFVGALIAGFLTAKKLARDDTKTGVVTGLLSYVVYVISIILVSGNFLLLFEGGMGDLLIILDFMLGSILGTLLRRI